MAGAQAGAAFGPYGIAIGAAAGLVIGPIKGEPKAGKPGRSGPNFGVKISDGLAQAITKHERNYSAATAWRQSQNLNKIISEAGHVGNFQHEQGDRKTPEPVRR